MSLMRLKVIRPPLANVWYKNEYEAHFWPIRCKGKHARDVCENSSFFLRESNRELMSVCPVGCKYRPDHYWQAFYDEEATMWASF